jgi:hypothetical protein
MEFDNPFDTLSYDEKIITDKIGMSYSDTSHKYSPPISMIQRIKNKLKEEEMVKEEIIKEELRREMALEKKRLLSKREPFTSYSEPIKHINCDGNSCMQQSNNSLIEEPVFNNKILIILIFVLAVFCIVQYVSQRQMADNMDKLMSAICGVMKVPGLDPVTPVAPVTLVAPTL